MKKETIELLGAIVLLVCIFVAIISFVAVLIGIYHTSQDYKGQCIKMGYSTFESEGWTGDFCKGLNGSIQVTIYKNKLVPLK